MSSVGERGRGEGAPPGRAPFGAREAAEAEPASALPLRLSVARGALGVELCEPLALGPLRLEELSLALVGLRYPVDLSKGVKQFRNRRATLERAVLRVDFDRLAAFLRPFAERVLGVPLVDLRLGSRGFGTWEHGSAPVGREVACGERGPSAVPAASAVAAPAAQVVSCSLLGTGRSLCFDWVLCSGQRPRWIVDRARGVGLDVPALRLALEFVDAVLVDLGALSAEVERTGRAVEFHDLSRALCLRVLPAFGFRVPAIGEQVVQHTELSRGALTLSLDSATEPGEATRRGLRLAGVAELARRGDEALLRGDAREARQQYLTALESSPRQPELSWILAALDLSAGGHGESALSFLEELRVDGEARSLHYALEAEALRQTGRPQAARESALRAAELEEDSALSGMMFSALARETSGDERLQLLERAIERAPSLAEPRSSRIEQSIARGELKNAVGDAEHLDALCTTSGERAASAFEMGKLFFAGGYRREAISWLKRAVKQEPSHRGARLALARAFVEAGENLRALELLQTLAAETLEPGADDLVRFELAGLLVREALDPSQAIAQLRAIDSRSPLGFRARALEAQLARELGDVSGRVRAHVRLLEAIELGWIDASRELECLLEVARSEADCDNPELALRAARLCQAGVAQRRKNRTPGVLSDQPIAALQGVLGQAVDIDEGWLGKLDEALETLLVRLGGSR